MSKEEYYREERAYEAQIEKQCELQEREEEGYQSEPGLDPAFSSWSDYYRYMYG